MEITTIHTENEPSVHTDNKPFIHIEHFFDIVKLENIGLKLNKTLIFCEARLFFNEP